MSNPQHKIGVPMSNTKILIVDGHRVVNEGIKSALHDFPEFEVVGEAVAGLQSVELAKSLRPDIMIMVVSMPNLNGIETTKQIKQFYPEIKIIIYTMYSDKEFVVDYFKAGVSAYVLKDDPLSDLILALNAVKGRGTYFSTMAPTILLRHIQDLEAQTTSMISFDSLSRREREIFCLLADGKPIKRIAGQLEISPKTVETHKYHIMKKLSVRSMAELTEIGIKKQLIKI